MTSPSLPSEYHIIRSSVWACGRRSPAPPTPPARSAGCFVLVMLILPLIRCSVALVRASRRFDASAKAADTASRRQAHGACPACVHDDGSSAVPPPAIDAVRPADDTAIVRVVKPNLAVRLRRRAKTRETARRRRRGCPRGRASDRRTIQRERRPGEPDLAAGGRAVATARTDALPMSSASALPAAHEDAVARHGAPRPSRPPAARHG